MLEPPFENFSGHQKWRIDLGEQDIQIDSLCRIWPAIEEALLKERGEISVWADLGPRPWWHRLLGAHRWIACYFWLVWYGDAAYLIFSDDNCSEYHASDPAHSKRLLNELELSVHFPDEASAGIPISKETAIAAVQEMLSTGRHPTWLVYEYAA